MEPESLLNSLKEVYPIIDDYQIDKFNLDLIPTHKKFDASKYIIMKNIVDSSLTIFIYPFNLNYKNFDVTIMFLFFSNHFCGVRFEMCIIDSDMKYLIPICYIASIFSFQLDDLNISSKINISIKYNCSCPEHVLTVSAFEKNCVKHKFLKNEIILELDFLSVFKSIRLKPRPMIMRKTFFDVSFV